MVVDAAGVKEKKKKVKVKQRRKKTKRKRKKKKKKTYQWVLAVDTRGGGDDRRGWVLANTQWW